MRRHFGSVGPHEKGVCSRQTRQGCCVAGRGLAYNGGVAVVTATKGGLMYEATVGGQKFDYEEIGG